MKLERSLLVNGFIAALALGTGVAIVATRERPTTAEVEARASNLFPRFASAELEQVEVLADGRKLRLQRLAAKDGGAASYSLLGDGQREADSEAAESFLRALELASFLRRFAADSSDHEALGLNAPRAELKLTFRGGSASLRVGASAQTPSGTTYVEVTEGSGAPSVGLVRTELVRELLPNAEALLPRALSPYALSDLTRIEVDGPAQKYALRRGQGAAWLDATKKRVQRDAVERFGLEFTRLKAERSLSADGASTSSAPTRLKLWPSSAQPPLELTIGGTCPGDPELVLVRRTSPSASLQCLRRGLLELLGELGQSLVDDAPFALHADEVESLVIEHGGKKLELWRHEKGFQLRAPVASDVELEAGNRRLDALLSVEGERVDTPQPTLLGLSPANGFVRLRSSSIERAQKLEEVLELGRLQSDGRLPVRRVEDGVVLLLSREVARAYAVDTLLLRARRVLDFGPSELSELEVEWSGERERLRRTETGGFALLEPRGLEHDGALAMDLVQALGTLSVDRWVSDADDGSFGLEAPRVRVRMHLVPKAAGPRSVQLRVGSETTGGAFAAFDSSPGVFVMAKSVVSQLTTLVLARNVFEADPKTLARIELDHAGRRIILERRGDDFTSSATEQLTPAQLARLLSSLSNLRAEAAVHTGGARKDEGFSAPSLLIRLTPAGAKPQKLLRIGSRDVWLGMNVYYARVDGLDVTYALPQSAVRELLDVL